MAWSDGGVQLPVFLESTESKTRRRRRRLGYILPVIALVALTLRCLMLRSEGWRPIDSIQSSWRSMMNSYGSVDFTYVVSYKTGTTIAAARLPTLMIENPSPSKDKLYFADSAFKLGDIDVLDTYANVPEGIKKQDQFQEYYRLATSLASHHMPKPHRGFWFLARYLDPYLLEETYRRYPNKDWYIVTDDDTYVNWETLLRWLKSFDPKQQYWLGYYEMFHGIPFAHGGGGFAISQRRMRDTFGTDVKYASRNISNYELHAAGDLNLGRLWLDDANVSIKGPHCGRPSFAIEGPREFNFNKDTWFRPSLSYGHMDPGYIHTARQAEDHLKVKGGRTDDIRYCDLYDEFVPKELPFLEWSALNSYQKTSNESTWGTKSNWTGIIFPRYAETTETYEECQKECEKREYCNYFEFDGYSTEKGNCHIPKVAKIRFGKSRGGFKTGYHLERINTLIGNLNCSDSEQRQIGWDKSLQFDQSDLVV